jgi:predicted esterase
VTSRVVVLWCLACAPGCDFFVRGPVLAATHDETRAGVRFVEAFPNGADERSPLIVALHGRGGTPEQLGGLLFATYPAPAELALPQAFYPYELGSTWCEDWYTGEEGTRALGQAEERLWPAIVELAHGRKVYVIGFSQGAMLAFVLAARHPDEIAYAVPISGMLPSGLWPRNHARTAPVYAVHGSADPIVPASAARATIRAFQEEGAVAQLREFPNVRHELAPEMVADALAHLQSAIQRSPTP